MAEGQDPEPPKPRELIFVAKVEKCSRISVSRRVLDPFWRLLPVHLLARVALFVGKIGPPGLLKNIVDFYIALIMRGRQKNVWASPARVLLVSTELSNDEHS